jgi:hypothetical protein
MKTIYITLITLFIYSCSNNSTSPTGPNHTTDTVSLFTKDSVRINYFSNPWKDSTVFLCTPTVDTLYVSFHIHADNMINGITDFKINNAAYFHRNYNIYHPNQFDTTASLKFILNLSNFNNTFYIQGEPDPNGTGMHLSMTNIKVWYIKRT